jgi:hypothetical protein
VVAPVLLVVVPAVEPSIMPPAESVAIISVSDIVPASPAEVPSPAPVVFVLLSQPTNVSEAPIRAAVRILNRIFFMMK